MLSMTRLKNLLILLLALALPLQGYAAAAMVFCGSEKVATASVAGHAGASMHRGETQAADLHATHSSHDNSSHDKNSSSCSSCAACCVGVIPLHSPLSTAEPLPMMHPLPFPLSGFVGYTPENPERPPSLLA